MKIGYGRVSARDQNPERQLVKFREVGIDERYIFLWINKVARILTDHVIRPCV